MRIGSPFTRIMLGGNVTVMLLFLINAVFRGAGDAAVAMRVLFLGNLLNIVLGPCFIFGLGPFPELGIAGAAVATNIGRGTAVVYQIVTLMRGNGRVRLRREHLRLDLSLMRSVLRLSGSGTLQILIGTASYIGLVRILSVFGSDALAGYTIGFRVIIFALLPAFGISNAAATMVGQNLGAGRPDRAERAVWTAALYNMVFLGSVGLVFFLAARPIAGLFTAIRRYCRSPSAACGRSASASCSTRSGWCSRNRSTAPAIRGRRRSSTSACSGCGRSRWRGGWRYPAGSARAGCSSR